MIKLILSNPYIILIGALSLLGVVGGCSWWIYSKGVNACVADYKKMQEEVFTKAQGEVKTNKENHQDVKREIIYIKSQAKSGNAVNLAFERLREKPYYSE